MLRGNRNPHGTNANSTSPYGTRPNGKNPNGTNLIGTNPNPTQPWTIPLSGDHGFLLVAIALEPMLL
jgi:hypothetical protein